jgi:hypothetical protein
VKLQLGLGDFRLQSYEAIEKWYAVVYHALVYLYWQCYEDRAQHGHTTTLSEVMTRMRQNHQREVLLAACKEAAEGVPLAEVAERYLGEWTAQAA